MAWVETDEGGDVVVVGPSTKHQDDVVSGLVAAGASVRRLDDERWSGTSTEIGEACCLAVTIVDSMRLQRFAERAIGAEATAGIPLEYVAVPRLENATITELSRLQSTDFISPLLSKHGSAFFDIYRESLQRFGQKTEIRDYLDLCQLLVSLDERGVSGNIAEFGSYRGHSGYLISRVLEFLGNDATVFMFDMFEAFPQEDIGVDGFWSGTHAVDFDEIVAKFADRQNVQLVRGDFTETIATTDTGPLSLAFVDCDSYRATRDLLPVLWHDRVVDGGVIVLEDYGHAALLGNRVAAHEFFDARPGAFTTFSQFSGLFVGLKLPGASS